jgi:hypothetical protein
MFAGLSIFLDLLQVEFMRHSLRDIRPTVLLGAAVISIAQLLLVPLAQSSCRDPEVAQRGLTSPAYAANVDATIQYFGHSFFLITTSKGTRIVTDPLGPGWYPNPNVTGDVVTVG